MNATRSERHLLDIRCTVALWLKTFAVAVFVIGVGTGCTFTQLWRPADEQVLERILPSAVQVVLEQPDGRRFRTASGVIIAARPESKECFVLTAGHTFSGAARDKSPYVFFGSHEGRRAKVAASVLAVKDTEAFDLCLLKAETDRCPPARVKRLANLGEWAWVVGFPWGRTLSLARGVVSQIDVTDPSERPRDARLMVDASVSYGASGAGVYEARTGTLIGVVEGYSTARVSSQGGEAPWYIDVPVPGQTLVTSLRAISRFLEENGYANLLEYSLKTSYP